MKNEVKEINQKIIWWRKNNYKKKLKSNSGNNKIIIEYIYVAANDLKSIKLKMLLSAPQKFMKNFVDIYFILIIVLFQKMKMKKKL